MEKPIGIDHLDYVEELERKKLGEAVKYHKENFSKEERETRLRNLMIKLDSLKEEKERLDGDILSVSRDIEIIENSFKE